MENGAVSVREPWEESDEFGSVVMATVRTVSGGRWYWVLWRQLVEGGGAGCSGDSEWREVVLGALETVRGGRWC